MNQCKPQYALIVVFLSGGFISETAVGFVQRMPGVTPVESAIAVIK